MEVKWQTLCKLRGNKLRTLILALPAKGRLYNPSRLAHDGALSADFWAFGADWLVFPPSGADFRVFGAEFGETELEGGRESANAIRARFGGGE